MVDAWWVKAGGQETGGILEARRTLWWTAFFCTGIRVTGSTQGEAATGATSTTWGGGMDVGLEGGCGGLKTGHKGEAGRLGEGG